MRELSFVTPTDPSWKRWLIGAIEDVSGRRKILPLYRQWRADYVGKSPHMMGDGLNLIDVNLKIHSKVPWPPKVPDNLGLVMIANHPFGIGDGVAGRRGALRQLSARTSRRAISTRRAYSSHNVHAVDTVSFAHCTSSEKLLTAVRACTMTFFICSSNAVDHFVVHLYTKLFSLFYRFPQIPA